MHKIARSKAGKVAVDVYAMPGLGQSAGLHGLFDVDDLAVYVDTSEPPAQQAETLVHELVHVASYIGEMGLPEEVVQRLSQRLAQLLAPWLRPVELDSDNPRSRPRRK